MRLAQRGGSVPESKQEVQLLPDSMIERHNARHPEGRSDDVVS